MAHFRVPASLVVCILFACGAGFAQDDGSAEEEPLVPKGTLLPASV